MTLTLTPSEMNALQGLFQNFVLVETISWNAYKKLQVAVLLRMYKRIYQKVFVSKKSYKLKLEPDEAIAFYLFFDNPIPGEYLFEQNLINQIRHLIHQKLIV